LAAGTDPGRPSWPGEAALGRAPGRVGARERQHQHPGRGPALGRLEPPGDGLGRAHLDPLEERPLVELLILPGHAQAVAEPVPGGVIRVLHVQLDVEVGRGILIRRDLEGVRTVGSRGVAGLLQHPVLQRAEDHAADDHRGPAIGLPVSLSTTIPCSAASPRHSWRRRAAWRSPSRPGPSSRVIGGRWRGTESEPRGEDDHDGRGRGGAEAPGGPAAALQRFVVLDELITLR